MIHLHSTARLRYLSITLSMQAPIHTLSYTIIYNHIHSYTIINTITQYNHIQSYTIIYIHTLSILLPHTTILLSYSSMDGIRRGGVASTGVGWDTWRLSSSQRGVQHWSAPSSLLLPDLGATTQDGQVASSWPQWHVRRLLPWPAVLLLLLGTTYRKAFRSLPSGLPSSSCPSLPGALPLLPRPCRTGIPLLLPSYSGGTRSGSWADRPSSVCWSACAGTGSGHGLVVRLAGCSAWWSSAKRRRSAVRISLLAGWTSLSLIPPP